MMTQAVAVQKQLFANKSRLWTVTPEYQPTYTVQVVCPEDAVIVQNIWVASQAADGLAFYPWSEWGTLAGWATASYLLREDGRPVGVTAFRFGPHTAEAAEARLALCPSHRLPEAAQYLVDAAMTLTVASGAPKLHLYLPQGATWAGEAARLQGFRPFRTQAMGTRPEGVAPSGILDIWRIDPFRSWIRV